MSTDWPVRRKLRYVILTICALSIFVACAVWFARKSEPPITESQRPSIDSTAKASLILKIARYCKWPQEKDVPGTPFVIGVVGNTGIRDSLVALAQSGKFQGRELLVKRVGSVEEIPGCHVLVVAGSEKDRLGQWLGRALRADALTIGESDNFLSEGGIFLLYEDGHLRFDYEPRNIKKTDVKVSRELLFMAERRVAAK